MRLFGIEAGNTKMSISTITQIVGLFCLTLVPFIGCYKIHNHFIEDEDFQADPSAANDYEVVQLWHTLNKRETNGEMILKSNNEEIKLYLQLSEGFLFGDETPVWLAHQVEKSGVYYEKLANNIMKDAVQLYFDPTMRAAIALIDGEEGFNIFGLINGRSVRSLPARFTRDVTKKRRDTLTSTQPLPDSADPNKNYTAAGDHIILNEPSIPEDSPIFGGFPQSDNKSYEHSLESDPSLPDVIYPELLITMDYALNIDSPEDPRLKRFLFYTFLFWNIVDLRFRDLKEPKVRLKIGGIIVPTSRDAVPYMTKNTIDGVVHVRNALDDMLGHLLLSTVVPNISHDILVTQTNRSLCAPGLVHLSFCGESSEGHGISRYQIKCSDTSPYGMSTVIFKDVGNFEGVTAAVTEIGDVLGAVHEGDSSATDCSVSEGYIMSNKSKTNVMNNLIWSKCSRRIIPTIINRKVKCLRKSKPNENRGNRLLPILPGDLTTLQKVCNARGWETSCEDYEGNCEALRCKNTGIVSGIGNGWSCKATEPPPEGSPCGRGKYCLNRKCVQVHDE